MPIGTGLAIGLGLASAGASVAGSAISSRAAGNAARTQAEAAERASRDSDLTAREIAELNDRAGRESLAFQREQWLAAQRNLAPYFRYGGAGAQAKLSGLLGLRPQAPRRTARPTVPAGPSGPTVAPSTTVVDRQYAQDIGPQQWQPAESGAADIGDHASLGQLSAASAAGGVPASTSAAEAGPGGGTDYGVDYYEYEPDPNEISEDDPEFGSLMRDYGEEFTAPEGAPGQFVQPTAVTMENDPGYQFRLAQVERALRAAGARGGWSESGRMAKALTQHVGDAASNEFGNVFNRAMLGHRQRGADYGDEYARRLAEFQQKYNIYNANADRKYNRLVGMSRSGMDAAGELNRAGAAYAGNAGNILTGTAGRTGDIYAAASRQRAGAMQDAAAARAGGQVARGNIWGALPGTIANTVTMAALMRRPGAGQTPSQTPIWYGG